MHFWLRKDTPVIFPSHLRKIYFHSIFVQLKNDHNISHDNSNKAHLSRLILGRKAAASSPLPFRYLRSTDHTETVEIAPRYSRRLVRTRTTGHRTTFLHEFIRLRLSHARASRWRTVRDAETSRLVVFVVLVTFSSKSWRCEKAKLFIYLKINIEKNIYIYKFFWTKLSDLKIRFRIFV